MRRLMPAGFSLAAFVLYTALSWIMWDNYISPSWDLGIFTQLAKAYANVEVPIVDIKGDGYNLLGDHFHPILVLLAPFYRLFPTGFTLLVIQSALFAASAWPIVSLAQERLGRGPALLVGGSYVLSWGLFNAVWAQFHEIAFAVPLLAFGLVWWVRGRKIHAAVAIALLVFVKEDLGLTVAAFGLAIYLRERSRENLRFGLFFVAWGLVWAALATMVILPALNPYGQWDYTDNLSLVSQLTAGMPEKAFTVALLILAAGIVGVRSPLMLIMLPTLAWRFVGNVSFYWGWEFHYSAPLIPIAAVALIEAATGRWRTLAPVIALAAAIGMLTQTRVDLLWDREGWQADASGALAVAQSYDTVASDTSLLAYLVPHTNAYWLGTLGEVVPDAVAVDRLRRVDAEEWAEEYIGGEWRTVYLDERWQVVAPAD
ncbi:DUF2079 domain-containing protein [Flaviflexus salsibiostraticola]|uniref:DUF2079 domain-containing protein n=1 Tax=Flaviflexus salsibiostraticola TaxID=1282737 RepID=UPI001B8767D5|nr:DUF2079 domain-containing protein [Flaviflexus salsibiostraticola]